MAAAMVTGKFLIDDGHGNTNYSGTLEDAFSAMADVGTAGCGIRATPRVDGTRAPESGEHRLRAHRPYLAGDRDRRRG